MSLPQPDVSGPLPGVLPGHQPGLQVRSIAGGVLVVTLPAAQRFDALRLAVRELFGNPPGRFSGARLRLDLGHRDLDMLEIRRLTHLVKDEFGAEVVGIQCATPALQRMAERELKLKVHLPDLVEAVPEPIADAPPEVPEESPTVLVSSADDEPPVEANGRVHIAQHTLRSGAVLRFPGDIHVYGDVNPGAHVVAGGNIVVFGALKGLAHAGNRDGGEHSLILAFDLRPTQLRVGKVIGLSPQGDPDRPGRTFNPEIAYVSEGSIVIEPYRGRLPDAVAKESA